MIERTLMVVKPDGVKRNLTEDIISRYESAGLKIIKRKELILPIEIAEKHYASTDEQLNGMGSKTLFSAKENGTYEETVNKFGTDNPKKIGMKLREWMLQFITSGKVVACILEGEDAVKLTRKITGFTNPVTADKGTVRGDFGEDSIEVANKENRPVYNLVHASGELNEAKKEIELWFGSE